MPSVAQIYARNKREAIARAKRAAMVATVERIYQAQPESPAAPLDERVGKLLRSNRPGSQPPIVVEVGLGSFVVADEETEPLPPPPSPAQSVALELEARYPELNGRVARALALVEAGQTEFPKYATGIDYVTMRRYCYCPDAEHRDLRADFGLACKHTLAQEIAYQVATEAERVTMRHVTDLAERRTRQRLGAEEPVEKRPEGSLEQYADMPVGEIPDGYWKNGHVAPLSIGDDIKRMLDQPESEPEPELSAEEREARITRGYEAALRPDASHRPHYEFKVRYGGR